MSVDNPTSNARQALMQALCKGVCGTFEVLASHAQVHPKQAQYVLWNLRHEGAVDVQHVDRSTQRPGRPRVVYVARQSANDAPFDALSFTRQVWR